MVGQHHSTDCSILGHRHRQLFDASCSASLEGTRKVVSNVSLHQANLHRQSTDRIDEHISFDTGRAQPDYTCSWEEFARMQNGQISPSVRHLLFCECQSRDEHRSIYLFGSRITNSSVGLYSQ